MRYSNATKGFYHPDFQYSDLPEDLIEISDIDWQAALQAQTDGNSFSFDADGALTIVPPSNEQIKTVKISQIKQEAAREINDLIPTYKQLNAVARALELVLLMLENGSISTEEQAELTSIRNIWTQIKKIRVDSNTKEASL